MKTLTIKDESIAGQILNEISLQFQSEYISIQQLIEQRVRKEVERYETELDYHRKGLVVPDQLENLLNGKRKSKPIDVEKQVYIALNAFQKNGFFILIDNEQVEDLDEEFLIQESTHVSFVKLTPLVGG